MFGRLNKHTAVSDLAVLSVASWNTGGGYLAGTTRNCVGFLPAHNGNLNPKRQRVAGPVELDVRIVNRSECDREKPSGRHKPGERQKCHPFFD
jgi:hypothetical protein